MTENRASDQIRGGEEMTSRERIVKQLEFQAMYLRSRESMLAVLVERRGLVMIS